VESIQPRRFLYYSSMSAYGAWPDNPVPIDESWQLRPRTNFRYAADKTELESDIQRLAQSNPEIIVSWVRPSMILGQGVQNYISEYVLRSLVVLLPDGADAYTQFVHEDDLARATWEILNHDARGPFNVCPEDWMTWSEIAKLRGRPAIRVPMWLAHAALRAYRLCCLPTSLLPGMGNPTGLLNFLRHPWVGAPRRLKEELGFEFKHSSRATFQQAWDAYQVSQVDRKSHQPQMSR